MRSWPDATGMPPSTGVYVQASDLKFYRAPVMARCKVIPEPAAGAGTLEREAIRHLDLNGDEER